VGGSCFFLFVGSFWLFRVKEGATWPTILSFFPKDFFEVVWVFNLIFRVGCV